MNLINDVWIPVRRKDGGKLKIAPWQITQGIGTDKEIIELAAVRPDFNGALIQFLIGLLQTTCAPKRKSDWRLWLNNPPSAGELRDKFGPVSFAFNLDGAGPRFMQENLSEDILPKNIEMLLMGFPQKNTCEKNADHFIKRGYVIRLCSHCAAAALFSLQLNAPANSFLRSGIRYGGPVTTVLRGMHGKSYSLWNACWLNIVGENYFSRFDSFSLNEQDKIFPWLLKTVVDSKVTIQDIHPYQIFWAMPRRIDMKFKHAENEFCLLCEESADLFVEEYLEGIHGISYEGIYPHPLTPLREDKNNVPQPVSCPGNIGYRYWAGFVVNDNKVGKFKRNPAPVVMERAKYDNVEIWAFGYRMRQMNILGWNEGVMPVVCFADEDKKLRYDSGVCRLIQAANAVCWNMSYALTKASNPKDRKGKSYNKNLREISNMRFWQETEPEFYRQTAFLWDEVIEDKDGLDVRRAWHGYLVRKALDIFNDMSQAEMIEDVNAERVAKAHNELRRNLYGKKLTIKILGLPKN
ncbi:MAG: type I-E CRISPR-associated protein Cse1/CasA [Candidatus Omnitrophota bacterium]